MRTVMVMCPHADDAAAFCGGTVAKFADAGWRVLIVRVTDDTKDSVGSSLEATKRSNENELREAARILGASDVIELGFPTDCLADASEVDLRERIVYLFRKHRPYTVLSFDPFGLYEGNMDHIVVAQAVEEAFWVSRFDLHHPEHFDEGLKPFAVCEQWYFARQLRDVTRVVDVTDTIDRRIRAFVAHKTMVRNILNMQRLQLETWGRSVPALEEAFESDPLPLLDAALRAQAERVGRENGLPDARLGEAFRIVRFGAWEEMFRAQGEPIQDVPQGPEHPGEI